MLACRRERGLLVLARRRNEGVEDGRHLNVLQHVGGAADVVSLRMGEDKRRQGVHAELPELPSDVRFGWPWSTSTAPSATWRRIASP